MRALTLLLLIGSCTFTNALYCYSVCSSIVDVHCGDSEHSNCSYTSINSCHIRKYECLRVERGLPRFDKIVRGKCPKNRPQCSISSNVNINITG